MLEVSLYEDDYHITTIFTDKMTLEGIGSFVKLFSEISGNQRVSLKIAGSKFKPNKKYLYEKNIRRIPSKINSEMKYYVVARGSKSYNIYTFDDLRFLSGVYIGIGFCKEDYSYIIRGIGETDTDIKEKEEKEDEDNIQVRKNKQKKKTNESVKVKESKDTKAEDIKPIQVKKIEEPIIESIPEVKDDNVDEVKVVDEVETEEHKAESIKEEDETKDVSSPSSSDQQQQGEETGEVDHEEEKVKNIVLTKRSPKIRMSPKRQSKKKVVNTQMNFSLMSIADLRTLAKHENIDVENLTKKMEIVEKIKEKLND